MNELILMVSGIPTANSTVKHTPYRDKIFLKTLAIGKGQVGVVEILRKDFGVFND